MEVSDIEEEYRQPSYIALVWNFSPKVISLRWKGLEYHDYLSLSINNNTREEELSAFLTELLIRWRRNALKAVYIEFSSDYCDPTRHEKLLTDLRGFLSSTSRIYL